MQNETGVESDADLTSGFLARRYGVSIRTLRYYEETGLLTPKRVGEVRLFSSQDLVRLELILAGKRLGLSLSEVGNMIQSQTNESRGVPTTRAIEDFVAMQQQLSLLEAQKAGIEAAIGELNARLTGRKTALPAEE